jgi:hypothetical protein
MNEADTLYKLFFAIMMVAATQGTPTPTTAPTQQTPTAPPPVQSNTSIMGVEFFTGFHQQVEQASQLDAGWIRLNSLFWPDVEPQPGQRNWGELATLEKDLIAASKRGMQVVLVVRRTPAWAQSVNGLDCSAPRREHLPAFATFMRDLVARYSQPPFNVKYWEMGNEPDLDPSLEGGYGVWGCWGDNNDPYYGGGYYAEMLKAIYPAMKSADPAAQVLVGGLLLECDTDYLGCNQNRFLEGIVRSGGAPYFDGVGFHAYDFFGFKPGHYINNDWRSAWNTTGPVMVQKLNFLRSVLRQYNVEGKYFMMTESSILCWTCSASPADHEMTKAFYVPQLFAAGMSNNVSAVIWYSYNSQWQQSPLVDGAGRPLPAHKAMQVLHERLPNAAYIGPLTPDALQSTKARGYKFRANGKEVWIIWALTQDNLLVTLPGQPSAIIDVLGVAQPAARAFVLTPKPLYVEW